MAPRSSPTRTTARTCAVLAAVYVALCLWADAEALHVSLGDGGDGLEFLAPIALGSPLSMLALLLLPAPDYEGPAWLYETARWAEVLLPQLINCSLLLRAPVRHRRQLRDRR